MKETLLIVGEIFVDYSCASDANESSIRMGGIVHAARGLWAAGIPFSVAAVCPEYLRDIARSRLEALGCTDFVELGRVSGSPNIVAVRDYLETGDQGYEELCRENKAISLNNVKRKLNKYYDVLIFPGKYNIEEVRKMLPSSARISFDIAYDIDDISDLSNFKNIETILISTSSKLFVNVTSNGTKNLGKKLDFLKPTEVILKENRGGARIFRNTGRSVECIPANLGITKNSVGVGDAFSAVYVSLRMTDKDAAAYKAMKVSSAYAQTKSLDSLREQVRRSFNLPLETMKRLGGVSLPWNERPGFSIYLAAPDFSYNKTREDIDDSIESLEYHNFRVRRPIKENGELLKNSRSGDTYRAYRQDIDLLEKCAIVFAVPLERDPGTLVEIGLAIEKNIPIIVFDPKRECHNTMVIAGSYHYSQSLDDCLNAVFTVISEIRRSEK